MPSKQKVKLNPDQKRAVQLEKGPLLVVAGAGTGKTRVISERVRYLIQDKNIDPKQILALTFTEKAAQEMLDRVDDIMPLGYEEPWINTFHSFADRILKAEGLEIGLDPSYKIIPTSDQWLLLRNNIFKLKLNYFRPLGNPTKFISAILKFISRLQDENISSGEFSKFVKKHPEENKEEKERWEELAYLYQEYDRLKLEKSKLDFGDLITWTIQLFEKRPNLLKKYHDQFQHILVDEFQDTNHAQYELIKLLSPEKMGKRSLMVVGDDSQSIYKFRGAAVSNILEFMGDYPQAEMITLLKNYRSTQKILDPAYQVIQNNNPDTLEAKLNISKKITSQVKEKDPPSPEIYRTNTLEDEVEYIIQKIYEILGKEPQYTYKDIAILARANNHLDPFVMALRKHGLPYQLVGNRGLYDQDEIRDVVAMLKVIINPKDNLSLYRVISIQTAQIPYDEVVNLLAQSRYNKRDLWEEVKESNNPEVNSLYETIREFQKNITKETPTQTVYNLVHKLNYLHQFLEAETIENELNIKNLNLFLKRVQRFEVAFHYENKEIPTIIDLVDYLDLSTDAGENPAQAEIEDIDTINLATVHSAKGLEFPVIFMVNLISNRFPTRNRKDPIQIPDELIKEILPTGDEHLQEERRLFYVGMTRAKKYLYLTFGKDYGGKRETTPSGYLEETGLKIQNVETREIKKDTQSALFGVQTGYREALAKKITDFTPRFLSYSQVESYKTCPLKYKYFYVLNIPTPPNYSFSFGTSIHNTLKDFHSRLMFDEQVTMEDLLQAYEKNWEPLGYLDEEHRKLRFEDGKKLLKKYYDKHKDHPVKPIALEKPFNVRIGGVKFFGRIDRIDPLPDGGVEIIDYKTGKAKTQKDVDKDAQVGFYAIGVKDGLKLDPKKMSLYFVEEDKKITTTRTNKELEERKNEVVNVIEKIKKGNFEATPGYQCNWCDYNQICPFAQTS